MTTSRFSIEQTDFPWPAGEIWPTMYDLPSENPEEPGLPDEFHDFQPQLLSATFRLTQVAYDQTFTASDLNLYYDLAHPRWYKRPDWFAVVGVSRLYEGSELRLSYVTWHERVNPYLVVELLSPGTAGEDLGQTQQPNPELPPTKWHVYERMLKIPYYVVFDRYSNDFRGFKLTDGFYQPISIENDRVWMPELGIGLGLWVGDFQSINRNWLRFFDTEGQWILTPTEFERQRADQAQQTAQQARQQAEQARQEADQARQQAARLAEILRAQGLDPDRLL